VSLRSTAESKAQGAERWDEISGAYGDESVDEPFPGHSQMSSVAGMGESGPVDLDGMVGVAGQDLGAMLSPRPGDEE
jgi:hypothetical protein